jgi:aspartyl-tRNA(Asn)/glutamyl-tRNA(Gln) amidotransferase subunit A
MSTTATPTRTAGVRDIAAAVARGDTTPTEQLELVLARIEATENRLQAWSRLDVDVARQQAEQLTAEAKAGKLRGVLHGVPVAVKDEFNVKGMPTQARGPGAAPEAEDATVVAKLRDAGALIVGKTHMPVNGVNPPTRNPWNLAHTPGGSSSGSGAVVGARIVPFGVAEQTGGSALRPGAFCGVSAVKPTYGRISRYGCYPFSWSKDTVGFIGLDLHDLALVLSAVCGYDPKDPTTLPLPAPEADLKLSTVKPPRIGIVRNFFPEKQEDYMNEAIDAAGKKLAHAGARVDDFLLPDDFGLVQDASRLVGAEAAAMNAAMGQKRVSSGSQFSGVELIPATYFVQARRVRTWMISRLSAIFDTYDGLLMATAPGHAPEGLHTQGDASLLQPWTFLGFPEVNLNAGLSPAGLPMGMQLVGAPPRDYEIMQTGAWCEEVLGLLLPPPLVAGWA